MAWFSIEKSKNCTFSNFILKYGNLTSSLYVKPKGLA